MTVTTAITAIVCAVIECAYHLQSIVTAFTSNVTCTDCVSLLCAYTHSGVGQQRAAGRAHGQDGSQRHGGQGGGRQRRSGRYCTCSVCVVCCRCVLETRVCEVTVSCYMRAVCTVNDSLRRGNLYVFRSES
jgi:hypothetical protein